MTTTKPRRNGERWPDAAGRHINAHGGGLLSHQGRHYWFGEHKIPGEAGNKAEVGVSVYVSDDLAVWTDAGVALAVSGAPGARLARGCIIERPKVLHCAATDRFVMWFHHESGGSGYRDARVGVAEAERPEGPYRLISLSRATAGHWPANLPENERRPLSGREAEELAALPFCGSNLGPIRNDAGGDEARAIAGLVCRRDFAEGQMSRDMTLFLDADGSAWHIHASEENATLHFARLTPDFRAWTGKYYRHFPGRFHEAPAVFAHRGKYYLLSSGCTGWSPNAARSAVADSLAGPWTELGNPCRDLPGESRDAHEGGAALTFGGQCAFVFPHKGGHVWALDRWRPRDAEDGRYVWLPIDWEGERPVVHWRDAWTPD